MLFSYRVIDQFRGKCWHAGTVEAATPRKAVNKIRKLYPLCYGPAFRFCVSEAMEGGQS